MFKYISYLLNYAPRATFKEFMLILLLSAIPLAPIVAHIDGTVYSWSSSSSKSAGVKFIGSLS
jgi:hypothetical protein